MSNNNTINPEKILELYIKLGLESEQDRLKYQSGIENTELVESTWNISLDANTTERIDNGELERIG